MKKLFKAIIKRIKNSKNVAIFGHQSPDGDCIGSMFAIHFLCEALGKNADAFVDDEISCRFNFIDTSFINGKTFDEKNYDLLISTDVADKKQLGSYAAAFCNFDNKIVIDHHYIRNLNSDLNVVINYASCCEINFEILNTSKQKLDKKVSTFLYMGIADDTGCFLHDNTSAHSHLVASQLLSFGADFKTINYHLFKLVTEKSYKVKKLLDDIRQRHNDINYVVIRKKFFDENGFQKSDIGDYVNYLLNFENTKVSFVMTEKQNNIYSLSFRSIKGYNVAKVAQHFGGGGHAQACGAEIKGSVEKNVEKILNELDILIKETGDVR